MDVDQDRPRTSGEGLREQDVEWDFLGVDYFVGGCGYGEGGVNLGIHFWEVCCRSGCRGVEDENCFVTFCEW